MGDRLADKSECSVREEKQRKQEGQYDWREKGHWEIERDIHVRVCALTWQKRDSWHGLDPDNDRKKIHMRIAGNSVDVCTLHITQEHRNT